MVGRTDELGRREVTRPREVIDLVLSFVEDPGGVPTVYALNTQSNVVPVKISFGLRNDVGGRVTTPYALATLMIVVIAIAMGGYLLLRKRAERWQGS